MYWYAKTNILTRWLACLLACLPKQYILTVSVTYTGYISSIPSLFLQLNSSQIDKLTNTPKNGKKEKRNFKSN